MPTATLHSDRANVPFHGHMYMDCRLVATVHMDGGPDLHIWVHQDGGVDLFFLTEPRIGTTCHSTIRKAFSQACKNGGWG